VTPVEANEQILAAIVDAWNDATARLTFDGELFKPDDADASVLPWVRVTIRELEPESITHGSQTNRLAFQRGLLWAQCFAPNTSGDGAGAALQLAQDFRDLVHAQSLGADPIHFDVATPEKKGVDGSWYRADVRIPYRFQERL
jgi:hypothetical protein